jgi:diguanylate cyclase (GGDEF)-like protein
MLPIRPCLSAAGSPRQVGQPVRLAKNALKLEAGTDYADSTPDGLRSASRTPRGRRGRLRATASARDRRAKATTHVDDGQENRIIVVEDDALTRKLLQRQLSDAGYHVAAYPDGRSALQAICQMGRGIVVADWSMPVMDGLELCRATRELQEMQVLGNTHVIMLTAFDTKEKVVEGLAAGANDYLTKPYHLGELLARVKVGERMLRLQDELVHRTLEVQKANAQMAVLASKLDNMANSDMLTGLPNRRCLFEHFSEAWRTTDAEKLPLSCLMLDVDRFKRINDTYGHATGDLVLRRIAEVIHRHTLQPELCGRFGGEEFVLIFPAIHVAAASALAEKLRTDIAATAIPRKDGPLTATVSCGLAEKSPTTTCADDLLRNADTMLYLAKQHGRDQTWLLDPGGQGVQLTADGPGLSVPAEQFAEHPAASAIRTRPRGQPLQCARANPDHQR